MTDSVRRKAFQVAVLRTLVSYETASAWAATCAAVELSSLARPDGSGHPSLRVRCRFQPEFSGDAFHRLDAKRNVLI